MLYASRDGDRRTLRTEGSNVVLAKNRYSLPPELSLSWAALTQAFIETSPRTETEEN